MSSSSSCWQQRAVVFAAFVLLAALSPRAKACATCGCTLSADAATGYSATAGWRLSAEFDFLNQDELRSGTRAATAEQVVDRPADPNSDASEIEHDTLNRYLTLGLSWSPDSKWNFDLRVPYVLRGHSTFGEHAAPFTAADIGADQQSSARVAGIGDAKLVVSYQGLLPQHNLGLQLGVKLATGHYGAHTAFDSGPLAGEPLDASLQAGTGSTDLIVGAYWFQAISQNFDLVANAQYQSAFTHRQNEPDNDFRPGNAATASIGLRYEAHPGWMPQLQLNLLRKSADQGALADRTSTAGSVAYLSPGITLLAANKLFVYGFVQVPLYSDLDGYQLFPHWSAAVGMSYAL